MEGKYIVASGPVIIENGKLLVNRDDKDDFYKFPGGTSKEGESLEETCKRRVKEEINADVELVKPLHPMILWENPQTKQKMTIMLIHFLAKLKNPKGIKAIPPIKEVKWLDINEMKDGKHKIAPNIKFLIEKGDIK